MDSSEAIRALRKQLGWTQKRLSMELRKDRNTIVRWEMDLHQPSREVYEKLGALATNLELADIFAEKAGLPPYSGIYLKSPPWGVHREAHEGVSVAPPTADERKWMGLLQKVLRSGNDTAVEAVQKNLIVFAEFVDVAKGDQPAVAALEPARRAGKKRA